MMILILFSKIEIFRPEICLNWSLCRLKWLWLCVIGIAFIRLCKLTFHIVSNIFLLIHFQNRIMIFRIFFQLIEAHIGHAIVWLLPSPWVAHITALSNLLAWVEVQYFLIDCFRILIALFDALLFLFLADFKDSFLSLLWFLLDAIRFFCLFLSQ